MFNTLMRRPALCAALLPLALGACSNATDGPAFFFGSTSASKSANGAAYAADQTSYAELEGQELTVRLARFVRDNQSGETVLQVSTETVTFDTGSLDESDPVKTITYAGETLLFEDVGGVEATSDNGQIFFTYQNDSATYSAVYAIYSYQDYFVEGLDHPNWAEYVDTEGFYAIGFETNPGTVAERTSAATYSGSFGGYGQALDAEGTPLSDGGGPANEVSFGGGVDLAVDFNADEISGALSGSFSFDSTTTNFDLAFEGAAITGNGFSADLENVGCEALTTCVSNSEIGGVFFGPTGQEISGVVGINETFDASGDAYTFIGAGGFVTEEIVID